MIVVAWAILLRVFWDYLFLPAPTGDGGWFGYVPLTGRTYVPHARSPAATALTWGAATILWAAVSAWLVGPSTPRVLRLAGANRAQRIVLVVALAGAAIVTAAYLTRPTSYIRQLGAESGVGHLGPELGPLIGLLVGLALIIVWATTSMWLFGDDEGTAAPARPRS